MLETICPILTHVGLGETTITIPNEDLGRPNQPTLPNAFPVKHFSAIRLLHRVLTPLKSAWKLRMASFVHPSNIFVWEGLKMGK